MTTFRGTALYTTLVATIVAIAAVLGPAPPVAAIDAGDPAPEFKLPSSTGTDIALADFRGKRWVFLEFYALDFQPA
jgi:hypothetical protein